jgi:uncharacterized membrane protein YqjE
MQEPQSMNRVPGGLFESLRALLATLVGMTQARAELLGIELEEEALRLVTLLVGTMIVLVLGGLALLFAGLFVVAAFWDTHRLAAVVSVTACFIALAAIAYQSVRVRTRRKARLLSATLGVLGADRQWLQRRAP